MKNYISEIVKGNLEAFDALYKAYRMQMITFFRFEEGLNWEDSLDLYQDICSILLNNIKTGRLKENSLPDSSIKAYLKKTGRFILYNRRRKRAVPLTFNTDWVLNLDNNIPDTDNSEIEDKLFIIRKAVKDMPMPCSQLLQLKFFMEKSGADIAKIMSYANSDSVKSQVNKCKAKLKAFIVKQFKEKGYEEV